MSSRMPVQSPKMDLLTLRTGTLKMAIFRFLGVGPCFLRLKTRKMTFQESVQKRVKTHLLWPLTLRNTFLDTFETPTQKHVG